MFNFDSALFFWISRVFLTGISGFFMFWGISLMIAAYKLDNPGYFIMTFFAASLIIMISAVLGLGFILSMIRWLKWKPEEETTGEGDE